VRDEGKRRHLIMGEERVRRIIEQMAREHGVSVSKIRGDMMEAIHTGYTSEDPDARERFHMMFGEREPTLEEFILTLAETLDSTVGLKH
jgi:hypothetical protein